MWKYAIWRVLSRASLPGRKPLASRPPTPAPPPVLHFYPIKQLIALVMITAAAIVLIYLPWGISVIGSPLSFMVLLTVAILDPQGLITLRATVSWWRITGWGRFWAIFGMILLFPITFGFYVAVTAFNYSKDHTKVVEQRRQAIEQLEQNIRTTDQRIKQLEGTSHV